MNNQSSSETKPSFITRTKSFYSLNPWKGRFILAFITITIILGVVRLALPQTIIYGATSWLKEREIDSTIEAININILDGTVSLVNAKGSKNGEPLFNIGLIDIHWHWAPLSEKTVVITKVVLDNLAVDIEQYTDEMIIGGVHIPLGNTETENTELTENDIKKAKPWAASLGEVVFTNLNICYLQNTNTYVAANSESRYIDYCVNLDEMSWGGTISYAADSKQPTSTDLILSSTGNFKLNGLTVTDNKLNKLLLSSTSNTLENVVISGLNNMHIDKLEMNSLSALQREDIDHKDAVRFLQLTLDDISLTDLNSLAIDSITLNDPGLYIIKLSQSDWEYQQWLPVTAQTDETQISQANDNTGSFRFAVNNIKINNSDFCYLESTQDLYYCFTQDSMAWNGTIQSTTEADKNLLSISGDLLVTNTNIRNPELKRDLIDIQSITLNKLNVNDLNEASFDALVINELTALQRGEKRIDSTLAFSNLALSNTSYTNNSVIIDSINLDGLSSTVSKNKNGGWEHDKWLSKSETKEEDTPAKEQTSKNEPILISIKSTNIKTDKNISFIDNSTRPSMKVGLRELDFNIDDLLSNKPDTDSPFKLSAKTVRHSTIDLAGTVRPFAEKISFDAKGKLKGFDLRTATPATKKAIGHIIKSGQLDADLKVLAVDGQLDSNIGLSLYKFHIKPMSKEDSAKLDEKFGMPLNQTLVLLRDKDDSIHLDIPITGDVNNPSFNPMDAIIKATSKAATVTLITFYTPYGLIYAGGNLALNLATALNFDPIAFNPGSSEIHSASKKQLDGLSKLLTEKPQVHLTLCGFTNQQDIFTLFPERKPKNEKEKDKSAQTPLTKEQTLKLNQLAKDRQVNSKNYLVKTHNIDHSRMILCAPEHKDDEESISGVEVNI